MPGKAIKLPESLPHCQLINILISKANSRHDIDFNFIGHLDNFHQAIRAIVGQINLLFPEYTPHDDQYHLKNLFHVADTILGNQQLESMNSAELFTLACSIYGHDWGMAVSDSEKHYIVTGRPPEGMTDEARLSLEWDRDSFCTFASKYNLPLDTINNAEDINFGLWQEYIRETHAIRSSRRTQQYFESIDTGVAESIMRVCRSHSLNFEELSDPLYPTIFSVLREEVNLRALSVYLRLIDLFDLAQDRTPYVLWEYVAPRNPISSMEWAKHRSLQPITCPRYLDGRSIRVDGSTDDHEVFAALEDLHQYCETQLKGCNDVLSRMNDPRHNLGIYNPDWRVAPRGFIPVSIRFDFDRQNMFNILSNEIYQGDYYVFLRELLQNSIDAIRFRRAVLQRKGYSYKDVGVIQVTVERQEDGYIIVTWKDDGIGMDEYVVRNYLAIAGKSYYRSLDFQREGIDIDPISRFGIGILSCFMAADLVEIETYKDPYFPPISPPLRIKIPSLNRQFRTEILPSESAKPGTTVKVYVDPNKIKAKSEKKPPAPFVVTPYVRSIAGFVEFPILVHEDNKKTVILNPYQDASEARRRFGEEYEITSISLDYPWDETILPQDMSTALATLREEHYDLKNDLKLDDYEGVLVYLVPHDDSTDFSNGHLGDSAEVLNCQNDELVGADIRWSHEFGYRFSIRGRGPSPSAEHPARLAVYRDGILVPKTSPPVASTMPAMHEQSYEYSPDLNESCAYLLLVNLTKSKLPHVDLSRTNLTDKKGEWAESIFQAHLRHILDKHLEELIRLEPADRLLKLARLSVFYNIAPEAIWQLFPKEYWPIPLLQDSGKIFFANWEDLSDKSIRLPPELIRIELGRIANSFFINHEEYNGFLEKWVGEPCLALFASDLVRSVSLNAIRVFSRILLGNTHQFTSVHFLKPPWKGDPPLLQLVFEPIEIPEYHSEEINSLLDKSNKGLRLLEKTERRLLTHHLGHFFSKCPRIAAFPEPFDKSYAYEDSVLNTEHPGVELLFHILSKILLSTRLKEFKPDTLGQLRDIAKTAIDKIPDRFHYSEESYSSWALSLRSLGEIAKHSGICSEDVSALIPDFNEFIPGSLGFLDIKLKYTKYINEFGQIL
jgi:hypothetical protein